VSRDNNPDNPVINPRTDDTWCVACIECEPGFEDITSSCVFESGFSGIEEQADSKSTTYLAFYREDSAAPEPPQILSDAFDQIKLTAGKTPARILSIEQVPEEDWETAWRRDLTSLEIGSRLVLRPSWIEYENPDKRLVVVIDPRMAFGTGGHETTRLCLEFLEKMPLKDCSILDAGCGSGVLSIAAVKLGARCAIGFDNDPDSVQNAQDNLRSNRVSDRASVYVADLDTVAPGRFDIVVANILSSVLIPNLGRFHEFLLRHGTVIFSGLLAEEEARFTKLLEKERFRIREIARLNEWIAISAEERTDE